MTPASVGTHLKSMV